MRVGAIMLAGLVLAAASPAIARDRALVIGIDRYPSILVDGVANQRNLFGAVNDARRMARLMTDVFAVAPDDVLLLTDGDATRDAILAAFRRHLVEETAPGDHVLFYYAGHGVQTADMPEGDEDDGLDEALVPSDGAVDLARPEGGIRGLLTDDEIRALIAELPGRSVTVIVDACHSGTITRTALSERDRPGAAGYRPVRTISPYGPLRLADPAALDPLETRQAHRRSTRFDVAPTRSAAAPARLAVWSAVSSAQFALEDMRVGGASGLFTGLFAEGLDGAADLNGNGAITAAELLAHLRQGTRDYCAGYDCLGQDPLPLLDAPASYDGTVLRRVEPRVADDEAGARPELVAAVSTDLMPAATVSRATVFIESDTIRVGDALRVEIRSEAAGRLVVLDRRDGGETIQLFPNAFELEAGDMIAAGESRVLPDPDSGYAFVADAAGEGTIVALVVDPAAPLADVLAAHADLAPIADPAGFAADLAAGVNRAIKFPGGGEEALAEPATGPSLVVRGEARYRIVE